MTWWLWLLAHQKVVGIVAAVIAVLGLLAFVYHKGTTDERDRVAGQTLQQIEQERRDREEIERRNRDLTDDAATNRLRPHR